MVQQLYTGCDGLIMIFAVYHALELLEQEVGSIMARQIAAPFPCGAWKGA